MRPPKKRIAEWWSRDAVDDLRKYPSLSVDLFEPACQACQYFALCWDEHPPENRWEKSALERAHIIAASSKGSDEPYNFLLLCKGCHKDAPMTNSREEMLAWASRRTSWTARRHKEFLLELGNLGIDSKQLADVADQDRLLEICIELLRDLDVGSHFGVGISMSSQAIVTAKALERYQLEILESRMRAA